LRLALVILIQFHPKGEIIMWQFLMTYVVPIAPVCQNIASAVAVFERLNEGGRPTKTGSSKGPVFKSTLARASTLGARQADHLARIIAKP
jgi:hypothetical protein